MRLKQNYIHKSKISGSKCKPYLYTNYYECMKTNNENIFFSQNYIRHLKFI